MRPSMFTTILVILLVRPRRELRGIVLTLYVCVYVCVSVCPANILVFYFSAIRRDIDRNLYRILIGLYSIH